MTTPFIGEIQLFGFNFAPRGWALCKGDLLPISQNTALFSLIGTIYGGNGQTTFQLPNFNERVPCSQGRGPGLTTRTMGESFGSSTVGLTSAEMPSHSHPMSVFNASDPAVRAAAPSTNNGLTYPLSTLAYSSGTAPNTAFANSSVGVTGGSQPHENEQPYLALNFSIALVGVYPSFP